MEFFPKYFLDFCTILGGLSAIVFFYEKIKNFLSRNITTDSRNERNDIQNGIAGETKILVDRHYNFSKNIIIKIVFIIIIAIVAGSLVFVSKSSIVLFIISGILFIFPSFLFTGLHIRCLPSWWYEDKKYIKINHYIQLIGGLITLSSFLIMIYAGITFEIYSINKIIFYLASVVVISFIGIKELMEIESKRRS